MTSLTYPSGRVVEQRHDDAGRLTQVLSGTTTFASGYNYDPSGAVTAFNYGNSVHASFGYNNRLQLETLGYTNGGTLFSLTYDYHLGMDNNGQIRKITDTVDSGRTVNYTYDELGRLKTAVTDGSAAYAQWGLKWTYDRYGNRTNQEVTAGGGAGVPLTINTSTNRISDRTYDLSGNLWQDGTYAYKYDAENRAVDYGAGGATYGFDGNGLRVKRFYGSTTVYIFSGSQVIAEYASGAAATSPTREYIYAGGLLASVESGTTKYYYPDHLSTRMTMAGGTTTQQGHYPFGENWYPTSTPEKWKFTSYERGDENGNDYAMFRSYISRYGRFQTPDPLGVGAVDPTNPQSWNRYAYVLGAPTVHSDPSGLKIPIEQSLACQMGYCGGGGGGWQPGILACGVDPFCRNRGGDGPFASPVAQIYKGADGHYYVGSYVNAVPGQPGVYKFSDTYQEDTYDKEGNWLDSTVFKYLAEVRLWNPITATVRGPGGDMVSSFHEPPEGGRVTAGSVWIPVGVAAGVTIPFASIPATNKLCVGLGVGFGSRMPGANWGPLYGDTTKAEAILSGASLSGTAQGHPFAGGQAITNNSGTLWGPTVGAPGVSFTASYSVCW